MSTRIVSSYVSGVTLTSADTTLIVTATGTVGGTGVVGGSAGAYTIDNAGTIRPTSHASGISLNGGGMITNGRAADTRALIAGAQSKSTPDFSAPVILVSGAPGTLLNFGTVSSLAAYPYGPDLYLKDGGTIINGSKADTTALIVAREDIEFAGPAAGGIQGATGTVVNYGTISAFALFTVTGMVANLGTMAGVDLAAGGRLVNGSKTDTTALIGPGVAVGYAVVNYATIIGSGVSAGYGTPVVNRDGPTAAVQSTGGGVRNGTTSDTAALIEGGGHGYGVSLYGGALTNYGTIVDGVADTGRIINGSTADTAALIEGVDRAVFASYVLNLGTVEASRKGLILGAGGVPGGILRNFGTVEGPNVGVVLSGSATVDNVGQISGATIGIAAPNLARISNAGTIGGAVAGISLADGGTIVNGGVTNHAALISGGKGVFSAGAGATLTNLGTIEGSGGPGIGAWFESGRVANGAAGDTEALIEGRIGVFLVAATLANLGTISGAPTGTGRYQSGVYLKAAASVTNGSSADRTATIEGHYGVRIQEGGGAIVNFGTIAGGLGVEVAPTRYSTAPVTVINAGTITGTGGTAVAFGRMDDVLVVKPGAVFDGIAEGGAGINTLELAAGGVGTLAGIGTAFAGFEKVLVLAGADWTLGGSNSLGGTGLLGDAGSLAITGALTVAGTLSVGGGAAALLAIDAGGVLDLAVDHGIAKSGAGSATLDNAGTLEKTGGAKGAVVALAVENTGTVRVTSGSLEFGQSITGTGGTFILGTNAQLGLEGSVAAGQTIEFGESPSGLFLGDAPAFKGTLEGFAAGDGIDVQHFGAGTTVTFVRAATGGTLRLVDGAQSATIRLLGQYIAAGFSSKADGRGGTLINYSPPATPLPQLAVGA